MIQLPLRPGPQANPLSGAALSSISGQFGDARQAACFKSNQITFRVNCSSQHCAPAQLSLDNASARSPPLVGFYASGRSRGRFEVGSPRCQRSLLAAP
jgi:hypothetical protein